MYCTSDGDELRSNGYFLQEVEAHAGWIGSDRIGGQYCTQGMECARRLSKHSLIQFEALFTRLIREVS
jgi:hypothetical protein